MLVDSITLPAPDITLTVAAPTFQLVPTVLPADATRPAVTYVSSDPTKATVDADGLVTRVANGTTNITVSATDGSGETVVKLVTCTA
ncbi:Bacterial Ig-like domain (group 2) [compost metagenome]